MNRSSFVKQGSMVLVASIGLLVPSVRAAGQPSTLDSLNAAHARLLAAKPDQAKGELQGLTARLERESSPGSKKIQHQVRYVVLELATGDVNGATSELEALIQETESSEPQASITRRPKGGGPGGGHGAGADGNKPGPGNPGAGGHHPGGPGSHHSPRPSWWPPWPWR